MFNNLKDDNLDVESSVDSLGGGFSRAETGLYAATIKQAYGITSNGGALGVHLEFDIGTNNPYTETIYVSNRNGQNYWTNDKGDKMPLPGYTLVNDICLIATGSPLSEQKSQNKLVKVFDFESKSEIPREMPVLVDLIGGKVTLGIHQIRANKQIKGDDGKYHPTSEEQITNEINKAFDTETKLTVHEARQDKEAEFYDAWDAKYGNKQVDKYKEVSGNGRPSARNNTGTAETSKMKFGRK